LLLLLLGLLWLALPLWLLRGLLRGLLLRL
jgi:hypothetical protein